MASSHVLAHERAPTAATLTSCCCSPPRLLTDWPQISRRRSPACSTLPRHLSAQEYFTLQYRPVSIDSADVGACDVLRQGLPSRRAFLFPFSLLPTTLAVRSCGRTSALSSSAGGAVACFILLESLTMESRRSGHSCFQLTARSYRRELLYTPLASRGPRHLPLAVKSAASARSNDTPLRACSPRHGTSTEDST